MHQIIPIHVCVLPDTEGSGPTLLATMTRVFAGVYEVRGIDLDSGEVFWRRRGSFSRAQMEWRRLTEDPIREGKGL